MLNESLPLVVEDGRDEVAAVLQALEGSLVRARFRLVGITVHHNALVTLQELLLKGFCVNHGWS